MIEYVPYKPKHFLEIAEQSMQGQDGYDFRVLADFHSRYPATTALDGQFAVASFGITPAWSGMATLWAVFSRDIENYGMQLYRGTKLFLDNLMESHHRLQCEVLASNEKFVNFIERFEFEREGTMRKYGPLKQDFYIYARVA